MLLVTSIYNGLRSRLVVEKSFPGAAVRSPQPARAPSTRAHEDGGNGRDLEVCIKKGTPPDLVCVEIQVSTMEIRGQKPVTYFPLFTQAPHQQPRY